MKQILVYSDSLSWGIIPDTRFRLPFDKRWPGVLEYELSEKIPQVRVLEDCLNGRRTVWQDPFKEGRDGSSGLAQVIEMHSPLALVILMLGTNDFQSSHNNNAWMSAQGTEKLIRIIRQAPIEPTLSVPTIMIVAPPAIIEPKGAIAAKFLAAEERSVGLAEALRILAETHKVQFFDSNAVIEASIVDGIHLDQPQHLALGKAISNAVLELGLLVD